MPPPRLPPTPSMSGELTIKDQPFPEGSESFFALPPAALQSSATEGPGKGESKMDPAVYRPASPTSPRSATGVRNSNPPRRAGTKRPLEGFDLPPPPTRTRKIIQMKPKGQTPAKTETENKTKDASKAPSNVASQATASKKKQPSATSVAGRKIARKTAHSLIERRRRSKMNEEFATLKDMIPACKGQEMHKLAILQASIDYVNYLEQCISDLKTAGGRNTDLPSLPPPGPPSPTSPDFLPESQHSGDSAPSTSASPELVPDRSQINNMSPSLSPRSYQYQIQSSGELRGNMLPSPALGPTRSRESSIRSPERPWVVSNAPSVAASPALQPQRNSVSYRDGDVDHEASAALLMLNMDRRGTLDATKDVLPPAFTQPSDNNRKMGMSVRDLLIS